MRPGPGVHVDRVSECRWGVVGHVRFVTVFLAANWASYIERVSNQCFWNRHRFWYDLRKGYNLRCILILI